MCEILRIFVNQKFKKKNLINLNIYLNYRKREEKKHLDFVSSLGKILVMLI